MSDKCVSTWAGEKKVGSGVARSAPVVRDAKRSFGATHASSEEMWQRCPTQGSRPRGVQATLEVKEIASPLFNLYLRRRNSTTSSGLRHAGLSSNSCQASEARTGKDVPSSRSGRTPLPIHRSTRRRQAQALPCHGSTARSLGLWRGNVAQ